MEHIVFYAICQYMYVLLYMYVCMYYICIFPMNNKLMRQLICLSAENSNLEWICARLTWHFIRCALNHPNEERYPCHNKVDDRFDWINYGGDERVMV